MANEAGAHFIIPVHHQTFRFSVEGFREPIERFQAALRKTPYLAVDSPVATNRALPTARRKPPFERMTAEDGRIVQPSRHPRPKPAISQEPKKVVATPISNEELHFVQNR